MVTEVKNTVIEVRILHYNIPLGADGSAQVEVRLVDGQIERLDQTKPKRMTPEGNALLLSGIAEVNKLIQGYTKVAGKKKAKDIE